MSRLFGMEKDNLVKDSFLSKEILNRLYPIKICIEKIENIVTFFKIIIQSNFKEFSQNYFWNKVIYQNEKFQRVLLHNEC